MYGMDSATMNDYAIIDSHAHWGPSITLGTQVTTNELINQQRQAGIAYVVVIPFPSTAIEGNAINIDLLNETRRVPGFIPYHYIRECYDEENFDPIPDEYFGGKWHWMRGWQDSASNYKVLEDEKLPSLVEKIQNAGKPVIFEEELNFTIQFVEKYPEVKLIIPHLGMLGGYPADFLDAFREHEQIYFDTALGSKDMILQYVRTVGPERVLFGSDVPFGTMRSELAKVETLPLTDGEKRLILSENIIRLAHLSIK